MENWKKRAIDLLTSVAFGTEGDPSVVPYYPQKTAINSPERQYFRRSSPEAHGISSKRIYNMLCELEGERRANLHSLIVLKDGEVISEAARDGYSVNVRHLSHSMSKTVTGMAVGMLVDDGKLDTGTHLCDIFPEIQYKDKRFPEITVEHLLTMTSGIAFSEAGSVTEDRWTDAYFGSQMKFEPGEEFAYNSMNSYMLARIVVSITGMRLCDFLADRLFLPLGIENYFWELGPEGIEKGGWGLYLSAESWAKLGQLYLDGGVFAGKRIISEKWVRRSSETLGIAPKKNGNFNYGYQMWVGRESDEMLFNGMLGQNVWICPKNKIVVAANCGNNELFQNSPALEIIRKYLSAEIHDPVNKRDTRVLRQREKRFFESRRWAHPCEENRGILALLGFTPRTPFVAEWNDILGSYAIPKNNVGMLPLFVRGMQNNLSGGISEIKLARRGDELWLSFTEADEERELRIGLYKYRETVLDFGGEKYIVKAIGDAVYGAVGIPEYRIELIFPELPNTRMLKLIPDGEGKIRIELSEVPNNKIVEAFIDRIPELGTLAKFAFERLEKRYGDGFLEAFVARAFAPTLVGIDKMREDWEGAVAQLESESSEQSRAVTLLKAFVERFISVDGDEDGDVSSPEKRGFFGGVLDKLRGFLGARGQTASDNDALTRAMALPEASNDLEEESDGGATADDGGELASDEAAVATDED